MYDELFCIYAIFLLASGFSLLFSLHARTHTLLFGLSMIFPKLLYVTLYSVLGSAIPYLSLFYDEALHLPSNQIGILLAIAPFLQSLACPVWTVVVDRRPSWHGPLMTVLSIIGGLAILTLTLIPGWLVVSPEEEDAAAVPADESSMMTITFLVTASLAFVFAFFGQPVATLVDSAVLKMLGDQKILYGKQRLWGSISNGVNILLVGLWISKAGIQVAFYVFAVGVASFAILALFTRFPPSADEYLEEQQNEWIDEYNEQARLRDPIAISARYGSTSQHQPPMAASSFMTAVSRVLSIGSTSENNHHHQQPYYHHYVEEGIPARRNSTVSHANTEWMEDDEGTTAGRLRLLRTATSVAQDTQMEASQRIANLDHMPSLGLALSNIPTVDTSLAAFADAESKAPPKSSLLAPRVCTFLVTMLLYGISYSMIAQFLFLFLRNDLGIDSALIGWTGPIGGVAEVSTFWISNKVNIKSGK